MARDTDAQPPEQPDETPRTETAAPTADADTTSAEHEPFPGVDFFHGGRNSPIVTAMARRLAVEGCWDSAASPGPDWTNAHRRSFASWQEKLRPKGGGNTTGIPDQVAWDKLHVPKAS